VADCCRARDYERIFGRRAATKDARRYRRRGLTGTARALADLAGDVRGDSVLDVGGGVGAIELELLAAGATCATNVEISTEYEDAAQELLAERGLEQRVERRIGDFVADADAIEPHDVVVMHRVVCCYPDADALVGAAAAHTRRRLLLTYPQERVLVRLGVRAIDAVLRVTGSEFRVYVHPAEQMVSVAQKNGLSLETRVRHGLFWESAAFARA
jgi:2-polyprenyl-3-methyl-5-hydroxy-6-metoxy-1,4-benzoquinol methylase